MYQTQNMKIASDFLNKWDLRIGEIVAKETLIFNYVVEEKPIEYFNGLIKQAYDMLNISIIDIKGGKIE